VRADAAIRPSSAAQEACLRGLWGEVHVACHLALADVQGL
jgi:hypothetical protein